MGIKKTQEQFEKDIFSLVGKEYCIIGKYNNNKTKIKFRHNVCNKEFEMKPVNFCTNGQRCPHCNSNFGKITLDIAKEKFLKKNLELLENIYINSETHMKYKCLKCGDIHSATYKDVVGKNVGCANCAKNKKLSFEKVKENIEKNNGYNVLSKKEDFKNVHSKLKFKHKCGLEYFNSYNNFRNGQRCPFCERKNASGSMSKQVRNIIAYLIENNIQFELEKKFDNLIINKRKARFDFYLIEYDLLIEFFGKQHYKFEKSGYFNEEKYKKIILSDSIKQSYVNDNNLKMEIISYFEDELDKLKKILEKYKKI